MHTMPNDLIRKGEEALVKNRATVARVQGAIIPMARGLLAARRAYPDRRQFNEWLAASPYSQLADWMQTSLTDCVRALCKIGEYEDEAIYVMHEYGEINPMVIWKEIKRYRRDCRRPLPPLVRARR
jgi:hypothetical protein